MNLLYNRQYNVYTRLNNVINDDDVIVVSKYIYNIVKIIVPFNFPFCEFSLFLLDL